MERRSEGRASGAAAAGQRVKAHTAVAPTAADKELGEDAEHTALILKDLEKRAAEKKAVEQEKLSLQQARVPRRSHAPCRPACCPRSCQLRALSL